MMQAVPGVGLAPGVALAPGVFVSWGVPLSSLHREQELELTQERRQLANCRPSPSSHSGSRRSDPHLGLRQLCQLSVCQWAEAFVDLINELLVAPLVLEVGVDAKYGEWVFSYGSSAL